VSPQLLVFLVFVMELVSSLVSILVGYQASKGYKASSSKSLLFLYMGFTVLGIGILLRAITSVFFALAIRTTETPPNSLVSLSNVAGIIFTLTQLAAYSLFTATYAFQAKSLGQRDMEVGGAVSAAVFPIARLFYIPALELLAITMLGFVAVSSLMHWLHQRSLNAELVFLGFSLMLLSHLLFLFMIFDEVLLFFGQLVQLAGFVCLLIMLAKVNKTGV